MSTIFIPDTGNPQLNLVLNQLANNAGNTNVSNANGTANTANAVVVNGNTIITPGGQIVGYINRYMYVTFSDDGYGTGNSFINTNKSYYGILNTNDNTTQPTNFLNFSYTQVSGGFGTTRNLYYRTTGGRNIQWDVNTAPQTTEWLPVPNQTNYVAIDLDNLTAAGQAGANGYSTYAATVYQASGTQPATPTGGFYTFTNTPVFTTPTGWYANVPNTNITVWGSQYTFYSNTPNANVAAGNWTTPFQVTDKNITYDITAYIRLATTPANLASPSGTWNFATKTGTPPTSSNVSQVWSYTIPAGSANLYAAYSVASAPVGGIDTDLYWSDPTFIGGNASGVDGISTYEFPAYFRTTANLSNIAPINGNYNFTNGALSTPPVFAGNSVSWSLVPYGNVTQGNLWVSTALASIVGQTGFDNVLSWSNATVFSGQPARSVYRAKVYQRIDPANANPTITSGTGNYDFTNNILNLPTGTPNNWVASIPVGNATSNYWPVWSSQGTANIIGDIGTSANITDWTTPVIESVLGANGSNGSSAVSVYQFPVYAQQAAAPGIPQTNTGYWDFATGSGGAPLGSPISEVWYTNPPTGNVQRWVSYATASANGTGNANMLSWSTPIQLAQTGTAGQDGLSIYQYPVYIRANTTPATPTNGNYNFATRVGTPPIGWYNSPGDTANTGNTIWLSTAQAQIQGTTGTWVGDTTSWSTPISISGPAGANGANGANGTSGANGRSTVIAVVYQANAGTPPAITGQGFYNFATNQLFAPGGWSNSIPANGGGLPIWSSQASFITVNSNANISNTTSWTTPALTYQSANAGGQGTRGFLPMAFVLTNTDPTTYSNTQLTSAFSAARTNTNPPIGTGYLPINGDTAQFYYNAPGFTITYSTFNSIDFYTSPAWNNGIYVSGFLRTVGNAAIYDVRYSYTGNTSWVNTNIVGTNALYEESFILEETFVFVGGPTTNNIGWLYTSNTGINFNTVNFTYTGDATSAPLNSFQNFIFKKVTYQNQDYLLAFFKNIAYNYVWLINSSGVWQSIPLGISIQLSDATSFNNAFYFTTSTTVIVYRLIYITVTSSWSFGQFFTTFNTLGIPYKIYSNNSFLSILSTVSPTYLYTYDGTTTTQRAFTFNNRNQLLMASTVLNNTPFYLILGYNISTNNWDAIYSFDNINYPVTNIIQNFQMLNYVDSTKIIQFLRNNLLFYHGVVGGFRDGTLKLITANGSPSITIFKTYNGTGWSNVVGQIISGNALVSGSITAAQINTNEVYAINVRGGSVANVNDVSNVGYFLSAAQGSALFTGNVRIGNNLVIGSNAIIGNNLTVGSNTIIGQSTTIGSNLLVANNFVLGNNGAIGNSLVIGNSLAIGNNTSIGSNLIVGNNTSIGSNLIVGNNATIGANLIVGNNTSIGANLIVGNNATIGANLTVTGLITGGNLAANTVGTAQLRAGTIPGGLGLITQVTQASWTGNTVGANKWDGNLNLGGGLQYNVVYKTLGYMTYTAVPENFFGNTNANLTISTSISANMVATWNTTSSTVTDPGIAVIQSSNPNLALNLIPIKGTSFGFQKWRINGTANNVNIQKYYSADAVLWGANAVSHSQDYFLYPGTNYFVVIVYAGIDAGVTTVRANSTFFVGNLSIQMSGNYNL